MCCPAGYGTNWWTWNWFGESKTCPLNPTKPCCKRTGFGDYSLADRIACSEVTSEDHVIPYNCTHWVDSEGKTVSVDAEGARCAEISTAIGNIGTDPQSFVQRIFSLVLGIGGGIALILIMISGYKYMTSQGNPEAVKAATEQLTAAIIGLLFIILSFVILQVIGVDILKIPGFG
jgi:hypothetical protein